MDRVVEHVGEEGAARRARVVGRDAVVAAGGAGRRRRRAAQQLPVRRPVLAVAERVDERVDHARRPRQDRGQHVQTRHSGRVLTHWFHCKIEKTKQTTTYY